MDRGAWQATAHGVAKRRLSDLAHTYNLYHELALYIYIYNPQNSSVKLLKFYYCID